MSFLFSCKLLIVGGGSGGATVSARFARTLNPKEIIVVEPSETHYYQPLFTLVGGGILSLKNTQIPTHRALPTGVRWLRDSVTAFNPTSNSVTTANGDVIAYDFMLVAAGVELLYNKIPGLVEGLKTESSGVCSNYSPEYVDKTFRSLVEFEEGNAIFTYPNTPVKCPGAPQKICYIAEHYLRKVRSSTLSNIF